MEGGQYMILAFVMYLCTSFPIYLYIGWISECSHRGSHLGPPCNGEAPYSKVQLWLAKDEQGTCFLHSQSIYMKCPITIVPHCLYLGRMDTVALCCVWRKHWASGLVDQRAWPQCAAGDKGRLLQGEWSYNSAPYSVYVYTYCRMAVPVSCWLQSSEGLRCFTIWSSTTIVTHKLW